MRFKLNDDGTEVLDIIVKHYEDAYNLYVIRKKIEGMFETWAMGQEGDFRVKIAEGRKSVKKLEKFNKIIEDNKDELLNLWKDGNYQGLIAKYITELRG